MLTPLPKADLDDMGLPRFVNHKHRLENMMINWKFLVLVSLAAGCNASASAPPRANASGFGSRQADLSKYQTFSFSAANPPVAGFETTERSLEVERRLAPLVQSSLEKRGYAASPDAADLLIKISAGSGRIAGEKVQHGNPTPDKPSGFIGIDAYDRATGVTVWHGVGIAEINPERIDDRLLEQGVERMFADFPTRRDQATVGALDQ